jgi:hypothetical protein
LTSTSSSVWQTFADLLDPPDNLYVRDPVGWVRDRLGEFMWSKQCEMAEALVEHRYVAVKSAHDTGKSHVASRIVAWHLDTQTDPFSTTTAPARLPEALESGAASQQAVDASVRRVLEAKQRMGLFDEPYVDEDRAREILGDPAHREVARIAAERSAVLLRNDGDLLPLDADGLASIAVIGPLADSKRDTLGPWVYDFDLDETVTVLAGIRAKVGDGVRVDYARGVPVVQREFPSMFDMFGGNRPAIRRSSTRRPSSSGR